VAALEASGNLPLAGTLRAARQLRAGDLDRAIAETRAAVAVTGDPALQLSLAGLLLQRHGAELARPGGGGGEAILARGEIVDLIESLQGTPQGPDALAFGLGNVPVDPGQRLRWAEAALQDLSPGNPALLPSAIVMVRQGQATPRELYLQLQPIFDAAPLERRSAFSLWLSGAGLPQEALTLITAQEAAEATSAFGARTEALFRLENYDAVLAASEAGVNVDEDVKLAARARAEYALGRGAQSGATSLAAALEAAARLRRLELILPTGDALGAAQVVDAKLAEMCGNPALSDYVFRVTRDRLMRRGRFNLLDAALERAVRASPESFAVADAARYRRLLQGEPVDPEETAAAVAREPANASARITHALALLRADRPADALANFDDITVFADRLPPGLLAVVAAVLAANGDDARARLAVSSLDLDLLQPGEYALIAPLRVAPAE
jgi:hypothetical protein